MSRYIDAEQIVYTWLIDNDGKEHDGVTLQSVIDIMPTADVVEVVRCKDCKYGEVDNADFPNQYFCNHHGCAWNEGNHYCGYGEREKS